MMSQPNSYRPLRTEKFITVLFDLLAIVVIWAFWGSPNLGYVGVLMAAFLGFFLGAAEYRFITAHIKEGILHYDLLHGRFMVAYHLANLAFLGLLFTVSQTRTVLWVGILTFTLHDVCTLVGVMYLESVTGSSIRSKFPNRFLHMSVLYLIAMLLVIFILRK